MKPAEGFPRNTFDQLGGKAPIGKQDPLEKRNGLSFRILERQADVSVPFTDNVEKILVPERIVEGFPEG